MMKAFMAVYENMVRLNLIFGSCRLTQRRKQGLDDLLSKHISHLFIRDPLVVFTETLDQDDEASSDHFEVSHCLFPPTAKFLATTEHSIHQLANTPIQTTASEILDWLESGISKHGGANDRL
jgi:hypothetical protein